MMMKHNHIFLHQLIILFKMIILYNLGLKNCENLLKDYFNLDYLNITVNFLNYEIYKRIIIYNTDYSIIKWYYICSKENIYYDESLKEILECYETCKSYNGIEINNCISCYNNRILTSRNTCEDVYEECGDDNTLRLFEVIDNGDMFNYIKLPFNSNKCSKWNFKNC